ncbi:MAG TPA: hypothetical protein VMU17_05065 [Elusimicrobiota bacterium]|nr:hypothetical protein [Elusimicrobiota bacterium]
MEAFTAARWILSSLLVLPLASAPLFARGSADSCGDEQLSCAPDERCCEHVVAMFSEDGATAPPYLDGKCIDKAQKCSDFWCGNRHCASGMFGMPSVCCVMNEPGKTTQYRCAYNELSCPGNTQQLTIRENSSHLNPLGS